MRKLCIIGLLVIGPIMALYAEVDEEHNHFSHIHEESIDGDDLHFKRYDMSHEFASDHVSCK